MIPDVILEDGQIILKHVTQDLSILDSAIVHHYDGMYEDPNQKARVDWVVSQASGDRVIEIGTATGYVISKVSAKHRVGVDNNIARLLLADKRYPDIDFYYANIFNLFSFENQFDCLLLTEVLEHLPFEQLHYALVHCIRTASRLVITVPHGDNVMTNPEHLWLPSLPVMTALIEGTMVAKIVSVDYIGDFILLIVERR